MADAIPAYKEVAVVFTSAFFSSLYITSLAFCYRWLLFSDEGWRLRKRINWVFLAATSVIFLLNLVYPVLCLRRIMGVVKFLEGNSPGHYRTPSWDRITRCTAANLTALIADYILIYRCWVVYERQSLAVIAFPVILWLGGIVCTILEIYFEIVHTRNPEKVGSQAWRGVNQSIGPALALIPFLASTVVLNCYSTYMLIRRINAVAREGESTTARQFRFIVRILAESGILYLSVTTAQLAAWFTTSDITIQILSLINVPVVGIAFNLVLIRSAQLRAEQKDHMDFVEGQDSEDKISEVQHPQPMTITSISLHHGDDRGTDR